MKPPSQFRAVPVDFPPKTAPLMVNDTDEPDETSFRALRPKTLRLSHFAPHPVSDAANDFIAPCCAMPLRFSLTIPRATSAVEPSRAAVLHGDRPCGT
jgi:hypothetical protein